MMSVTDNLDQLKKIQADLCWARNNSDYIRPDTSNDYGHWPVYLAEFASLSDQDIDKLCELLTGISGITYATRDQRADLIMITSPNRETAVSESFKLIESVSGCFVDYLDSRHQELLDWVQAD